MMMRLVGRLSFDIPGNPYSAKIGSFRIDGLLKQAVSEDKKNVFGWIGVRTYGQSFSFGGPIGIDSCGQAELGSITQYQFFEKLINNEGADIRMIIGQPWHYNGIAKEYKNEYEAV